MSGNTAIWLDGAQTSSLPLPDRGLEFGDGVFETFLVHDGNPLYCKYHLDRLRRGLQALDIPDCLDTVQSQLSTAALASKHQTRWMSLRLTVLRGSFGRRGYSPERGATPRILIYTSPLDRDCTKMDRGAEVCVTTVRLSPQPLLAGLKHLNRLEQILAAVQVQDKGVDEGLLCDQTGHLTSVIAGNIFLVCDGELLTPALVECGVEGTRRRLIIEKWAPTIGLRVRETRLPLSALDDAEELFYSNSLQTVRPIVRMADQHWENHDVCEALFAHFLKELG